LHSTIRNEKHPIDFIGQERCELELRSLVRDEPRFHSAPAQQSEIVPRKDRLAAKTGRDICRDDYDFHLATVENTH
jgi:hypothetical protein